MSAEFYLPDAQVEKLFRNVAEATKQSTPELMRDVMKLWVADLVRQTYPKTKQQMAKRVESETAYLFVAGEQLENESLRAAFKRGAEFTAGALQIAPNETEENMLTVRNSVRNRRGRVTKRPGVTIKAVKGSVLKRHIRAVQSHIGRLKAGWSRAAAWAHIAIPAWAASAAKEQGAFRDEINVQDLSGGLEAENSVPYADEKLKGQFMDFILSKRIRDLTSGHYRMRWEKKMKREFESRKIA
jgi:hypothetical protein